jgi:UDP-2-acetamido-2-deoxy-ribo-hexuluronate aminotransferase
MNIQMVDTVTQYKKIKREVDAAVMALLDKGTYIGGEAVKQFGQNLAKYLDVNHVIPCANGTDALQIALMALGCKPGDEVITPSFTYIATIEVIALLGLRPVFVEVNPMTFTMDVEDVKKKITAKTKVILPVHLYGQAADMEPIMQIAKSNNLFVVEDVAQAIGGDYTFSNGTTQKLGTIGDIACTSFYPSKNLGAFGDGGAIMTNNNDLAESLRMICNHGQKKKYVHDSIGVNSRLDAIQAAILAIKLTHLEEYTAARRDAANTYDTLLAHIEGLTTPFRVDYGRHVFHQYTIKIEGGAEKRDALKAFLSEKGIPTMIYYPIPSHLQKAYLGYGYTLGSLPISEELTNQVISLPIHSELPLEQIEFIVENIKKALL